MNSHVIFVSIVTLIRITRLSDLLPQNTPFDPLFFNVFPFDDWFIKQPLQYLDWLYPTWYDVQELVDKQLFARWPLGKFASCYFQNKLGHMHAYIGEGLAPWWTSFQVRAFQTHQLWLPCLGEWHFARLQPPTAVFNWRGTFQIAPLLIPL